MNKYKKLTKRLKSVSDDSLNRSYILLMVVANITKLTRREEQGLLLVISEMCYRGLL